MICHNDLKTLMDNKATSGAFPDGLDKKYFLALHELVDKVLEKLTDESPPFVSFADTGRFAVDDVNEFLDGIEKT